MASQKTWDKAASNLGYKDERTMLKDLFETQGMPASKIAIMCGCGYNTICNRLRRHGLKPRPLSKRPPYQRSLSAVDDKQLFAGSAIEAAEACGVHRSTVHRERLRRLRVMALAPAARPAANGTSEASDAA